MKILIVSNMYPTKSSPSIGVFIKKCFDQLSSYDEFEVQKSIAVPNKFKLLSYINFYINFFVHLSRFNPDVVYCHFISHTGILGLAAKYMFRKKLIINCHGSDIVIPLEKKNVIHRLNKILLKVSDLIVVPSNYFEKLVCGVKGRGGANEIVVYPSAGVFIPQIDFSLSNVLIENKSSLQVGFVGNLIPQKGIDVLVYSLEMVEFPVLLHVAGKGDASIFENIKNNKVMVKVYGEIFQDRLKIIYSQIDVLIFPTLFKESLGLVPIEAMAYCVPVIGSNIGAVSEYVVPGETGYLIEPGNAVQLLRALEDFNGLSAEKLYDLKVGARKMSENYGEVQVSNILIKAIEDLTLDQVS